MKLLEIAVDCDGFLANFVGGVLRLVTEVTGRTYELADVAEFSFGKALKLSQEETRAVKRLISTRRGFVTGLQPYPHARQGIRRLRELGNVFCVTSPWDSNPWWRAERESWLALHFGIDRVHHAHDKRDFEADLFVDDRAKRVRQWHSRWPDRTAVFWRTMHNSSEAVPPGAHSIGSFDALYQIAREVALGPAQRSFPIATEEAAP